MDLENAENPELLEMLKVLANEGDYESQKCLGYMFFSGEGVNKNTYTSIRWYELAYKNEHTPKEDIPDIAYYLGVSLKDKGDYSDALKLLEPLENNSSITPDLRGHVKCVIAETYYSQKNYEKCKEMCEEIYYESITPEVTFVAYGEVWPTLILLSNIYLLEKTYPKALAMHKIIESKAGDKVLHESFYNNYGYANEMCKDYSGAMKYYTKAYELGCLFAGLNIGNMYNKGLGVEIDKIKGAEYFEKCNSDLERWRISRDR